MRIGGLRPRTAPRGLRLGARPGAVAGALLLATVLATGCDSTQQKNQRAKLQAERLLAARKAQKVTRVHPDVRVESVSLVRGSRRTAVVVALRSSASRTLTDLPIAVGVRSASGRRVPLNGRRNMKWFQTHVPAIPARGTATWVFVGRARIGPRDRPYARVGVPAAPVVSSAGALPKLDARVDPGSAALSRSGTRGKGAARRDATARVVVENPSDVPQYGLQVYALAQSGSRYVAAGKVELEHLGTGKSTTAEVSLTGAPGGRPLKVLAIPTIFE